MPAPDRHQGIKVTPEHTRVPNQLLDLVFPWLSSSEQACLLYIIRRTYGFASPEANGQRKKWDRIALDQFSSGTRSGDYVLDHGTGLTRTAVIKALRSLEERQLVWISYECPTVITKDKVRGCGWSESDEDHYGKPVIDPRTKAYRCPRCSRTLSKAYALRTLTPGLIKRFLNANDPQKRTWAYDPRVGRFHPLRPGQEKQESSATQADRSAEIQALRDQLWYPEQVDQIIAHAVSRLKSGKMAQSRVINGFLRPILDMQENFTRQALSYGLSEAVRRKVAAGPGQDTRWQNYIKTCARSYVEKQAGGKDKAEAQVKVANVEEALQRCSDLNGQGEREQARQALHDLLADHLDTVTEEFDGDRALARRHLLEAYKRGLTDYAYVLDYTSVKDYLPDWNWEDDERAS